MARKGLGQAEWDILQYVASNHPVTVRDVAQHVAESTGQARTTVLTVMERLRKKGYLVRRKQNGIYSYSPKESAAELTQGLVQNFVQNMLGGMLSPFFAYLSRSSDLTDEQLAELKELVRDLEARREGEQP